MRHDRRLPDAWPLETFETLPVTLDLSPGRGRAVGRLGLAVAFLVAAAVARDQLAVPGLPADGLRALAATALPLALVATALVSGALGLVALLSRRTARFDSEGVGVTGRTLFGPESWQLPYGAFEGVSWRTVQQRSGRKSHRPNIFQVIELVHADPARTLPLYVEWTETDARAEWEGIARRLGLPAIDNRGGAGHVRAAGDLDKSVRELAAEGKVDFTWDPSAEPPAGLAWEQAGTDEGEALVVRLLARRYPLWLYLAVAAAMLVLAYFALAQGQGLFALVAIGLAVGTGWCWRHEGTNPRTVRVTRREVTQTDPFGPDRGPLPLNAIEEIRIVPPRSPLDGAGTLLLATDEAEIRVAGGLGREALEWLRAYLTAAVVEA